MSLTLFHADRCESPDPFGLFDSDVVVHEPAQLHKNGVLLLWGGEDIGTDIYGQQPYNAHARKVASKRDLKEKALFSEAVNLGIPIIGICRGAQMVCALSGGTLAQHIDNHGRSHSVTLHDEGDVTMMVNSSHHQMMLPPLSAEILASSIGTTGIMGDGGSGYYHTVNEVVYFPTTNALGIQPHPEWANCPREFVHYCTRKIKEYLL